MTRPLTPVDQRYLEFAAAYNVTQASSRACPCRLLLSRRKCRECGSYHPSAKPPDFRWESLVSWTWRDHVRLWHRDRKTVLFTSEPYLSPDVDIEPLRDSLCDRGLRLNVTDDSPWSPGSTTMLMVTRLDGDGMAF